MLNYTQKEELKELFERAKQYEEEGDLTRAKELFEKRALLGGEVEEVFGSFYRMAAIREKEGDSLEQVIDAYLRAYHALPSRIEPLYDLVERMIRDENYVLGYVLSEYALTLPCPEALSEGKRWIYEYGALRQFAKCGLKIKRINEVEEALQKMASISNLPMEERRNWQQMNQELLELKRAS